MTEPVLSMQAISKAFPGVKALDNAALQVVPGEIHGLVGENGAGKSTIIKVLAGVYTSDAGSVQIDGLTIDPVTPATVHAAGVRFIHQELHLVPHFTVAEAVFLGQEISSGARLNKRQMRAKAEAFLADILQVEISGDAFIRDLGTAERKLVQIARALIDDQAKLVVFDEPTAPLSSAEIEQLFGAIRRLKDRGIAMVYVSHYLGEITSICDRVTVFRNGETVDVFDQISQSSANPIIRAMVGRDIADMFPGRPTGRKAPLFAVQALSGRRFENVEFDAPAGEIIGIAGIVGSGRDELIDTIYGLSPIIAGQMTIGGARYAPATPADAVNRGVAMVPRDRRNDGLVLDLPVGDNINLASLDEVASYGWEHRSRARARADEMVGRLDVRPRDVDTVPRLLSGGNQQKVVLGRWLARGGEIFILDEPTVGVDVGAKVEIYRLIGDLATKGSAVIVSSSDPSELIGLCDRILVMVRGRIVADLQAEGLAIDTLIAHSTGGAI